MKPTQKVTGPSSDEREASKLTAENVRLQDGTPLHYLLLDDPDEPIVSKEGFQGAKDELQRLAGINEKALLTCQGKTREEALRILAEIEHPMHKAA